MNEEHILLRDFLATMNRLQADFERRLDGIERDALSGALSGTPAYGHPQETTDLWQPWPAHETRRPLGLEAIWTDARRSPDGRTGGHEARRNHSSPRSPSHGALPTADPERNVSF
ncbi:hypothetical protein [Streptomyces sp. SID14515]|uniref:hypothetical protein n=1 Tax=Streptomyces sp. SID14515 TaxID=2706074 RepID=UPI0013C745B8|nr:hypothetical protein [Streptomyces sp. SID14515]NEB35373.1 hypothetical protein [Streptomyces sp. SID14515]